jgi:Mrp family chromosome partitioning ATPase
LKLDEHDLARLKSQVSRGEVILFTGAGFSLGAKDHSGRPVPSVNDLKKEIWSLLYPDEAYDQYSSIGDLYGAALHQKKNELANLIRSRLTVRPDDLPEYYLPLFNFPWLRCYTLNIDDLESAVGRRFELQRQPITISAREAGDHLPGGPAQGLEIIHLNGVVPNAPESLTFSETQYAERIASQEPWYARCAVELTSRPVIFIGTVLSESLLWHHMELRKQRGNLGRDLRPTSILVTKEMSLPRRDILRDLRINWVQGTAEEFATEILPQLNIEATRGFSFIRQHAESRPPEPVRLVSQILDDLPAIQTEYLLGDQPQWADLLNGKAIERAHDDALLKTANAILNGESLATALALTGTAGTGKSTALMSLALKLSGSGIPVVWVDKDTEAGPTRMRQRVREFPEKVVLAIDDADMYGRELNNLLRDLVPHTPNFLFVFAVRAGKLDQITTVMRAHEDMKIQEHVVPPLTDGDIDSLIDVLDKNHRLGLLTGKNPEQRRDAFRRQAGRQLLVAMIQATSDENFEKKAQDEYNELEQTQKYPYALIAVTTALRYSLTKDEILLAQGDAHEEALVALDRLTARHLVFFNPQRADYQCRHRVIADIVFGKLKEQGELSEVLVGMTWALATKSGVIDRYSRTGRFLIRLINHEFLMSTIGMMTARDLYTKLEGVLGGDYHYWLQRGSLEVESGDIRKAENFLGAARSLGEGDFRVDTAYGYMLMRKAVDTHSDIHAEEYLNAGIELLEDVIDRSGAHNSHPYHVLGSQGIAWVHRCGWTTDKKRAFLSRLVEIVERGLEQHPTSQDLFRLRDDLKKEVLMTVVSKNPGQAGLFEGDGVTAQ